MRNPNGYGSVVKLSGARRKPFCARKTVGWTDNGYPIYKAIGYYATRQEAMIALAEYNRSPYDLNLAKITLKELYLQWSARDFPKMSDSAVYAARASFKHAAPLYDVPYKSIKAFQMQEIIDNCGRGYATQGAIKSFFAKLDNYALELDIITKCNSALVHAASIVPSSKTPFSEEEIDTIWAHADVPFVDTILILLYTGFRISELLSLEVEKINFSEGYLQGGLKTKSGKDRIVPIHPRILKLVEARAKDGGKHLIMRNGKSISSRQYRFLWNKLMHQFHMTHTPHECRHTFRSRLDSAGANKVCIDLMMGHKNGSVGERVYTHKTIQELREAIALVT